MKKFLTALKYFFLALGLLFLEQLPTAFITKNQPFWQSLVIVLALLVVVAITIYVAKRVGLLNHLADLKTAKAWKTILLGFIGILLVEYAGRFVLILEKGLGADTVNQATLEQLGMSPLLLIVWAAIAAPIAEETIIRGLILGRVFNNSYLGVVISSLLFGLLHMPTDIGSWIIYGGMGLVLALIYHKTEKLEYTIGIHFINNALEVLVMLL